MPPPGVPPEADRSPRPPLLRHCLLWHFNWVLTWFQCWLAYFVVCTRTALLLSFYPFTATV